ncbi:hypothetical protein E2C01_095943 [Portunus trituberculatus]|uniref:Uncharacterized protein n=1 Tax=Portunus trituberculatus TaxID=210409 RepID=A0A5B7K0D8_PORTR|nr:hypothetical protein [Portunus trituberculatus]
MEHSRGKKTAIDLVIDLWRRNNGIIWRVNYKDHDIILGLAALPRLHIPRLVRQGHQQRPFTDTQSL